MTKGNPLVSIIVPVYNREELIGQTIQSVLNQKYSNWELILVDDGSVDSTLEILKTFNEGDSRVKYYKRESELRGAQICRNFGFLKAKGEYVMFMDSDDLLAPFCIEQRVNSIESKSLDVAIFQQLLFYNEPYDDLTLVNINNQRNYLSRFLQIVNDTDVPWVNNSVLWRRKVLVEKGIEWDKNLKRYQDIDFHLNVFWNNLKFEYFEISPDCFWRQHEQESIGKKPFTSELFSSNLYFLGKIMRQLKDSQIDIDTSIRVKMRLNFYHMVFIPCIKSHFFKLGKESIKWARKENFVNFSDSLRLYVFLVLNFSIPSDRLKKWVSENFETLILKRFSQIIHGDFKKHQYNVTS